MWHWVALALAWSFAFVIAVRMRDRFRPEPLPEPPPFRVAYPSFISINDALEPWRAHNRAPDARLFPVEFLATLIPAKQRSDYFRFEPEKMGLMLTSISENGFTEPISIVVDDGRFALEDGHHRLSVVHRFPELDLDELPVVMKRSHGIHKHAMPLRDLLERIW